MYSVLSNEDDIVADGEIIQLSFEPSHSHTINTQKAHPGARTYHHFSWSSPKCQYIEIW